MNTEHELKLYRTHINGAANDSQTDLHGPALMLSLAAVLAVPQTNVTEVCSADVLSLPYEFLHREVRHHFSSMGLGLDRRESAQ